MKMNAAPSGQNDNNEINNQLKPHRGKMIIEQ